MTSPRGPVESDAVRKIQAGQEADLGDGDREGEIRGDLVRALCVGELPEHAPSPDLPIHIRNAKISGILDLRDQCVTRPITFTACTFTAPVSLSRARVTQPVIFDQGVVESINAEELLTTSDLILRQVTIIGGVRLSGARINGTLQCTGSTFERDDTVLTGDHMIVNLGVGLDGVTAHGGIDLVSAHIGGDLDCTGAAFGLGWVGGGKLGHGGLLALKANHLVVEGEILFEGGFWARGEVRLQWAHTRVLRATGAHLSNRGGCALRADGLHATDDIFLDGRFRAVGAVTLVGARLGDELRCTGGQFLNHGPSVEEGLASCALDVERIEANDIYLDRGFRALGQVRLVGAQLETQLNCSAGVFHCHESRYALDADDLVCGGDVFLNDGFDAVGEVSLVGAKIGRELNCTGGRFAHEGGIALNADGMTTEGSVFFNEEERGHDVCPYKATGQVRFARATVGRQLDFTNSRINHSGRGEQQTEHSMSSSSALDLGGLMGKGDTLLKHATVNGGVNLSGARIERVLDCTGATFHVSGAGRDGARRKAAAKEVRAFDGTSMRVDGAFKWKAVTIGTGIVDLMFSGVGILEDDLNSWPGMKPQLSGWQRRRRNLWPPAVGRGPKTEPTRGYIVTGFTYKAIGETCETEDWKARERWLRGTIRFSPLPWQRLAAYYRQIGQESDAKNIGIALHQDRLERMKLPFPTRIWYRFLGLFTGYGYLLYRPFLILLALGFIGIPLFGNAASEGVIVPTREPRSTAASSPAPNTPTARQGVTPTFSGSGSASSTSPSRPATSSAQGSLTCGPNYPCFESWLYPFALLMPVLNLWLVSYWLPSPHNTVGLIYYIITLFYIAMGWILGTAVVAGLRHLMTSE